MERVSFIELLDRRGRVKERIRLTRLPATVGRAYTNDVIVEDRYVSPEHCSIREDESGDIVVQDRGSVNGLRPFSGGEPVSSLTLRSGDRFRCGETVLRFVSGGEPVAPAEPMPRDEGGLLHALRDPRLALGLVGASFAALVLDQFLSAYYDTDVVDVVSPAVLQLGLLALWAGVWAFANRLIAHRFDFLRHLACSALAAVGSVLVSVVSSYAEFVFSWESLGTAIELFGQAAVVVALLGSQLAILPASTRRRRRLWATGGALLMLGLLALINLSSSSDDPSEIPVHVPLKALGADWIPAVSTSEFLEQARSIQERADEEAATEDSR